MYSFLRRTKRKFFDWGWLMMFISDQPVAKLIRYMARRKWYLLAVNLVTALLEALSEGASLGVVFLAVELLSKANSHAIADLSLIRVLPGGSAWIADLPWLPLFLGLLLLSVLLQALKSLTRYLNALSIGYFNASCRAQVVALIHKQILSFTYACSSLCRVGDLTDIASQGPEAVRIQIQQFGQLLVNSVLLLVYLSVLIALSPWLLLAALGLGTVLAFVQYRLLPLIQTSSRQLAQLQMLISARVTEDIQGLRLLHSTGQLEVADHAIQSRMGDLEDSLRYQSRLIELTEPIASFMPMLVIALLVVLSLAVFGTGGAGVLPSLVTFVLSLQRLSRQLSFIAGGLNQLAENTGRLERLNAILSPVGKQFRRLGGKPFPGLQKQVCLESVWLHYSPDISPALADISLTLVKGKTVALVGSSGAGKSSLADLLVGLYAPTRGCIRIDDEDMMLLDLSSWQQRLGVVSQDTFLFNASLAENIAFGYPGATRAEIEQAAVQAQAADFISQLPQGYDTLVGERGYRLSGGQRQRISLARAILRRPDLLILDEATSALDSESERLVQEALYQVARQTTVLVIAHRLSTVVQADLICVMDKGRVVEQGSHTELLQLGGFYARLWQQQARADVLMSPSLQSS